MPPGSELALLQLFQLNIVSNPEAERGKKAPFDGRKPDIIRLFSNSKSDLVPADTSGLEDGADVGHL